MTSAESEIGGAFEMLGSSLFQPYRAAFQQRIEPYELKHDIAHLITAAVPVGSADTNPTRAIGGLSPVDLINVSDGEILNALESVPESIGGQRLRELRKQIRPFLGSIIPTMRDSVGFLMSVLDEDNKEEKGRFQQLYARELRLRPVVDFYEGKLTINGHHTDGYDIMVDGVLFIILHNLSKNIQIHGEDFDEGIDGEDDFNFFGAVDYNTRNDSWTVLNTSTSVDPDKVDNLFDLETARLGLLTARMYAALLGKDLTIDVSEVPKVHRRLLRRRPQSPQYLVEFQLSPLSL